MCGSSDLVCLRTCLKPPPRDPPPDRLLVIVLLLSSIDHPLPPPPFFSPRFFLSSLDTVATFAFASPHLEELVCGDGNGLSLPWDGPAEFDDSLLAVGTPQKQRGGRRRGGGDADAGADADNVIAPGLWMHRLPRLRVLETTMVMEVEPIGGGGTIGDRVDAVWGVDDDGGAAGPSSIGGDPDGIEGGSDGESANPPQVARPQTFAALAAAWPDLITLRLGCAALPTETKLDHFAYLESIALEGVAVPYDDPRGDDAAGDDGGGLIRAAHGLRIEAGPRLASLDLTGIHTEHDGGGVDIYTLHAVVAVEAPGLRRLLMPFVDTRLSFVALDLHPSTALLLEEVDLSGAELEADTLDLLLSGAPVMARCLVARVQDWAPCWGGWLRGFFCGGVG